MGGHHLGDLPTIEEAIRLVHEAIDGGITFFDNCWEYYNGRTENWLGRALKGKRDKVFLMTKVCTHGRGKDVALAMLEQSLRRLQTDHLDLWQVHGMGFDNDPDLAYARGGVIEALDRAKKDGKVRFVGFTGHKDPHVHLRHGADGLQVGQRSDAAEPLRRDVPQFRQAGAARTAEARHRGAGHEVDGGHGRRRQERRGQGRGDCCATP